MNKMENTLWVEKYRPTDLSNFLGNEHIREKIQRFIDEQDIPHLLFSGRAGTGKTTLAKLLIKNIECDYLMINASDENSVDTIRNKIKGFITTISLKNMKIVVLDEADHITPQGQAALRNMMEQFSQSSRFILTCNYGERIIDPIHSRCQSLDLTPPSMKDAAVHLADILNDEGVEYEAGDVKTIVETYYPDIRKVINTAQMMTQNDKLVLDKQQLIGSDVKLDILNVLMSDGESKQDRFKEVRELVHQNNIKDFSEIFSYLYEKIDIFEEDSQPIIILELAEAQSRAAYVVDQEINFAAVVWKILDNI